MNRPGFTLLEFVAYSTLFSMFALGAFGFCATMVALYAQQSGKTAAILKDALAFDCVRRDVMFSSKDLSCWDISNRVMQKEFLDSRNNSKAVCVGWDVVPGKAEGLWLLRRSEGAYDFVRRSWISRTMSWIASSVIALEFKPVLSKDRGRVVRVRVIYRTSSGMHEQQIVLRNRVLV